MTTPNQIDVRECAEAIADETAMQYSEQPIAEKFISAAITKALDAQAKQHQREHDLVRQQRAELHEADLITTEEYAALAGERGAVERLESYDEVIAKLRQAESKAKRFETALEKVKDSCTCKPGEFH